MQDKAQLSGSCDQAESKSSGSGGRSGDDDAALTVLAEVAPGVVAAFGDIPTGFALEEIDLAVVPSADREMVANALSALGNTAGVVGHLSTAAAKARGIYRLTDASLAHMARTGGSLAVKDGANLGTIVMPGGGLAQARFVPLSVASPAILAASAGPALAMIALQASLNQLNDLIRTNIALTSQVLKESRQDSWSELTGLVKEVQRVMERARQAGAVTDNLWSTIAGKGADLEIQRDRYRKKVSDHISSLSGERRVGREYLETNAEAIAFDSYALFSSLKAWVGYQAMLAARENAAGTVGSPESRVVQAIVDDIRTALGPGLGDITELLGSLRRELELVDRLPERSTLPKKRRKRNERPATSSQVLGAIQPLTDRLLPPLPDISAAEVHCLPGWVDRDRYLRVLQLNLDSEEQLRAFGLPDEWSEDDGRILDKTTMIAVTDRRILSTHAKKFLRTGEISRDLSLDELRYVRYTAASPGGWPRARVDVIMKTLNLRWDFPPDVAGEEILGLAGLLAESMRIPEPERTALVEQRTTLPLTEATTSSTIGKTGST